MDFTFPRLNEVAPNGSVVQSAVLEGKWRVSTPAGMLNNADQQFVLAMPLFSGNATAVVVTMALFEQLRTTSFANATIALRPELAKLSLLISGWPWLSSDNFLEVAFSIDPAFSSARSLTAADDPDVPAGVTVYELLGQHGGHVESTIRVLNVAEVAHHDAANPVTTTVDTESLVNSGTSELVLRFPYFNSSTLIHDPGTASAQFTSQPECC